MVFLAQDLKYFCVSRGTEQHGMNGEPQQKRPPRGSQARSKGKETITVDQLHKLKLLGPTLVIIRRTRGLPHFTVRLRLREGQGLARWLSVEESPRIKVNVRQERI